MGLGKSLTAIALLWTLLKQSPLPGQSSAIKRALICCPASLLNNWKREINKWIGDIRLKPFIVHPSSPSIDEFVKGRLHSVLIVGYEKLLTIQDAILEANFDCTPTVPLG
jgi:DNA repair and recombination protein RAD54B